jgi:hypothetical protein
MSKKIILVLSMLCIGLVSLVGCAKEEKVDSTPPKGATIANPSGMGGGGGAAAPAPVQGMAPQKPAGGAPP